MVSPHTTVAPRLSLSTDPDGTSQHEQRFLSKTLCERAPAPQTLHPSRMEVVLYDNRESICCQMTRLVLAEKGVAYRAHPIDISGARNEQFEPWYLELNPKGVVPTLQVDGEVITDTLKITPFVDEAFDGPSLLPAPETRAWMAKVMALGYKPIYRDKFGRGTLAWQAYGRQLPPILISG